MVVMPVIKLSPNLASKGSEAPMARFVEPSSEAGSIAGQPLRKRSPSTHSGWFAVWRLIISERHLVFRGNLGPPQWLERKNSQVIHCLRCAFLAVRAKWILSCDKCQAPDHFGPQFRPFRLKPLTLKLTIRVAFCQYSNTLMHPIGHAAPRARAVAL
jgi:hypothetical protein